MVNEVNVFFSTFFSRGLHIWPACAFCAPASNAKIARLPAILLYFINRPSGETDVFMKQLSSELRRGPTRLHFTSIQNTNEENGRSS